MSNITQHKTILHDIHNIYIQKNHDYGDSFGKSIRKYGVTAALVRMSDKWERLNSLLLSEDSAAVPDESVYDTLLDLANYAVMTYMEMNNLDNYDEENV